MSVEFEKVVLEKLDELSKDMRETKEKVNNNSILINSLTEKVDIQGQNLASFENEFTIKVQALFDSFVSNTQSHLSYEKSIAALNTENFRQDARISKLEDYFKSPKILATN